MFKRNSMDTAKWTNQLTLVSPWLGVHGWVECTWYYKKRRHVPYLIKKMSWSNVLIDIRPIDQCLLPSGSKLSHSHTKGKSPSWTDSIWHGCPAYTLAASPCSHGGGKAEGCWGTASSAPIHVGGTTTHNILRTPAKLKRSLPSYY